MSNRGPEVRGDMLCNRCGHVIQPASGTSRIHQNSIIPFTLHQMMKYTNEGVVRTLIAKKHSSKRVKNYFTNSLLYQDSLEIAEDSSPEDSDSGNEADTEPEPEEEYLCEINSFVMSIDKLDLNSITNDVSEWFNNKDLESVYLSMLASDSVLSDTSTNIY